MQRYLAVLILVFRVRVAGAQESLCNAVPEIAFGDWPGYDIKECECSSSIASELRLDSPKGFSLIAVCGRRNADSGGYFFRGASTITGRIKRNEYASGANLYFSAPQNGHGFASALGDMKFIDEAAAFKKFKPPELDSSSQCWEAEATVKVSSLFVLLGGTDEAGNWPLDYDVLNVGEYERCEPEA